MEQFSLNILIVEDNLSFAIELEMMVKDLGYQIIGRVDNSRDAFKIINKKSPDLILMDIDIKGSLTGIEIAEQIKTKGIPILFITSFAQEEYYLEAKKTNLIGYMVKPVNKFSLRSSIEMAFRDQIEIKNEIPNMEKAFPLKDALFFKKGGTLFKVQISDILFVQADDDYCVTYTLEGKFHSSLRLSEMYELLGHAYFFKVHRSYLVSLDKIQSVNIQENYMQIKNHQVPISRSKKTMFLQRINMVK